MGLLEALGLKKKKAKPPGGPPPKTGATVTPTTATPPRGGAQSADVEAARALDAAKKRFAAFAKRVDAELAKAQAEVDGQPIAALKATLQGELAALQQQRAEADGMDPPAAAERVQKLDSAASNFTLKAARLRTEGVEAEGQVRDWGEAKVRTAAAKVNGLSPALKNVFAPRLRTLQQRLEAAKAHRDKGEFDKVVEVAGRLFYDCDDLVSAIDHYATDHPKYEAERKRVVAMLERMKAGGMLDAVGNRVMAELENKLGRADALGPIRGYAIALASLNDVTSRAKTLRDTNAAYKTYQPERDKVAQQVAALKQHKQAQRITRELAQIEERLKAADALAKRPDGGALKALTALKALAGQCRDAKALADRMEAAAAKLPALTEKLKTSGVPKDKVEKTAQYALKVLVEENCSDDDAVKMAKDAGGYVDEGLDEPDAIMSARVKKSLEDDGLAPEHAKAIGKNIRAGGTSSAADAKAVAKSMKHISKKAIDTLTADNIHTECCRGPITDAIPDLAGVKPRGWPETSTWDEVPGVYSGNLKKLVVGTMNDGGGRKVPEAGEGPIPHGASDLFGHEAGHAFDAAKPGGKKDNAQFLAARTEDVTAGSMVGGTDSYFMTTGEGGANDAGATSETFAESFAMHFKGGARWPKLEQFWASNPWGI